MFAIHIWALNNFSAGWFSLNDNILCVNRVKHVLCPWTLQKFNSTMSSERQHVTAVSWSSRTHLSGPYIHKVFCGKWLQVPDDSCPSTEKIKAVHQKYVFAVVGLLYVILWSVLLASSVCNGCCLTTATLQCANNEGSACVIKPISSFVWLHSTVAVFCAQRPLSKCYFKERWLYKYDIICIKALISYQYANISNSLHLHFA